MRILSSLFDRLNVAVLISAVAGALIGAMRKDRRNKGCREIIKSVLASAAVGYWLHPLCIHFIGDHSEALNSSVAFFLGVWGIKGYEMAEYAIRRRLGSGGCDNGEG
jgi:hypothetical protein